jgi:hypothetical protein
MAGHQLTAIRHAMLGVALHSWSCIPVQKAGQLAWCIAIGRLAWYIATGKEVSCRRDSTNWDKSVVTGVKQFSKRCL